MCVNLVYDRFDPLDISDHRPVIAMYDVDLTKGASSASPASPTSPVAKVPGGAGAADATDVADAGRWAAYTSARSDGELGLRTVHVQPLPGDVELDTLVALFGQYGTLAVVATDGVSAWVSYTGEGAAEAQEAACVLDETSIQNTPVSVAVVQDAPPAVAPVAPVAPPRPRK